jgi:hypothetical protein
MLFKCEESFYPIFISTAADAGLKCSIGKNYLSPSHAMINSQLFHISGTGHVVRKSYLNQKIVYGKTGVDSPLRTPIGCARDINTMVRYCPWTSVAIPMAMSPFRTNRNFFGSRPNWFLPPFLGGYGLDPAHSEKHPIRVTREQRLIAATFISHPEYSLFAMKGNMSLKLAVLGAAVTKPILAPRIGPLPEGYSRERGQSPWLERLAMATWVSTPHVDSRLKLLRKKIRHDWRLRPMKGPRLEYYLGSSFTFKDSPLTCPKLVDLTLPLRN